MCGEVLMVRKRGNLPGGEMDRQKGRKGSIDEVNRGRGGMGRLVRDGWRIGRESRIG